MKHEIVGAAGGFLSVCSCGEAVDDFAKHLLEVTPDFPDIDHLLWQNLRDALPKATDEQITELLEKAKAIGREMRDK